MKRPFILTTCLAFISLLILTLPCHATDPDMIYVRYMEGNVRLAESGSHEWMEAMANTPLIEGDTIKTGPAGRVELFLKDGSLIRIGQNSVAKVIAVESKAVHLKLDTGMAYVVSRGSSDVSIFVDTPMAGLDIARPAITRIDVYAGGPTEVSVYDGNIFASQQSGRMLVDAGQRLVMRERGIMPVIMTLGAADDWYAWNAARDRALSATATNDSYDYLPNELRSYSSDFDANGQWIYTPEYQYVWVPTVVTAETWSPYRFGRWVWIRGNYVWVGYEPWGWAPYHYGRWIHHDRAGWCWVPPKRGHVQWEPAHVAWVHSSRQIGWLPLAPGEKYDRRLAPVINRTNTYSHYKNVTIETSRAHRNAAFANSLVVTERNVMLSQKRTPVNITRPVSIRLKTVGLPPGITPTHVKTGLPDQNKAMRTIQSVPVTNNAGPRQSAVSSKMPLSGNSVEGHIQARPLNQKTYTRPSLEKTPGSVVSRPDRRETNTTPAIPSHVSLPIRQAPVANVKTNLPGTADKTGQTTGAPASGMPQAKNGSPAKREAPPVSSIQGAGSQTGGKTPSVGMQKSAIPADHLPPRMEKPRINPGTSAERQSPGPVSAHPAGKPFGTPRQESPRSVQRSPSHSNPAVEPARKSAGQDTGGSTRTPAKVPVAGPDSKVRTSPVNSAGPHVSGNTGGKPGFDREKRRQEGSQSRSPKDGNGKM